MGAGPSKATDEKVILNETPIQFSPDVVNQLADQQASPHPSAQRQATLDAHVQSRIHAELGKLRSQEEQVRREIEQALEKENLDRERTMAGEGGEGTGSVKSSAVLLGDLEEIQSKVDRFQSRKKLDDFPEVKESQEALIACYKSHSSTTLECWKEVQRFKTAVSGIEQSYFRSLQ